ncbi:MAG TPA: hypothetical protein IAC19_06325 [Candidatus Ventricola gallistercoris]|nr:hypothetical protein [Candidatus Ventricola gallistercoris]
MKKKTVFCVILWLMALCVCLALCDRLMRRDDGARKYGPFFEDGQDYDVLFFGTSRVLDGVSPMELWRDYGITSYNMGNSSECLEVTEWVLRLSLEHHVPNVALIDVYYVDRNRYDAWAYPFRHMFFDEIPLSRSKVQAVRATLPEYMHLEFLMPFSLYHGRWEEILSGQTERMVDCEPFMMGSELRIGRVTPDMYPHTDDVWQEELPGHDALRRIVSVCRENGIEPVFLMLPAPISEQEQMYVNSVAPLAQELGVTFLDMRDLGVVDFYTDCYDWLGHLNPDGASKVTAYLGDWLKSRYDLEDKRTSEVSAYWNENLAQYEAFRKEQWGDMTLLEGT